MAKGIAIIYTHAKPPRNSHMTPKESEYLENMVSQLKNQISEMSGSMLKLVDFLCSQEILKRDTLYKMENLMDQNIETMLLQRFPKRDVMIQGNHKNKENNSIEA